VGALRLDRAHSTTTDWRVTTAPPLEAQRRLAADVEREPALRGSGSEEQDPRSPDDHQTFSKTAEGTFETMEYRLTDTQSPQGMIELVPPDRSELVRRHGDWIRGACSPRVAGTLTTRPPAAAAAAMRPPPR
jgi:hypothetical protein